MPAGTWEKLPRRSCRRRRPRSVAQAGQKPSPLGEYRPIADRPDRRRGPYLSPATGKATSSSAKRTCTTAVTLAERTSRYTVTAALPDGYGAPQVAAAVTAALGRQPAAELGCAASGMGPSAARWPALPPCGSTRSAPADLGIEVFFCEPRARSRAAATHQRADQRSRSCADGKEPPAFATSDKLRLSVIEDKHLNYTCPADSTTGPDRQHTTSTAQHDTAANHR